MISEHSLSQPLTILIARAIEDIQEELGYETALLGSTNTSDTFTVWAKSPGPRLLKVQVRAWAVLAFTRVNFDVWSGKLVMDMPTMDLSDPSFDPQTIIDKILELAASEKRRLKCTTTPSQSIY